MADNNDKKYFVVKDRNDLSITYFQYDKKDGYDFQPRNVKIKDAIDVDRMIVINPSMIQKLAFRKVNIRFQRIVKLLMFVLSDENEDDGTGGTYHEAMNEINKLRMEITMHYKNKLKSEDFNEFNKKLDVLEEELKNRLYYLQMMYRERLENSYENEEVQEIGRRRK